MKKKVSLAKRLKLAEARADDAQRQFNEAERRRRELQIEANLWHGKFKDAQMHAKVEHDLLTEAREEITKLKEWNMKLAKMLANISMRLTFCKPICPTPTQSAAS